MSIEIRDSGRFWSLSGRATTYNNSYFVNSPTEGTFRETIVPGAFENAINPRTHVELRVEHDAHGPVLASTTSKTLKFQEAPEGLLTGGALAKSDPNAVAAIRRYEAGELRSFSVGMVVIDDEWPSQNDRRITVAYLREVSLVSRPCNPAAVVTDFRHETRSTGPGAPVEYRMVHLTRDVAVANSIEDPNPTAGHIKPPNLRDAMDAAVSCATCEYYNDAERKSCQMYAYAVAPYQLCDSYETAGENDADDVRERARRTRLALIDDGLDLLMDLRLRGRK